MKAEKIEACWLCKYCHDLKGKCAHSTGPNTPLPRDGVHSDCPLPDWPEVALLETYKQWFKLAPDQMSIGTPMGEKSFIQFIDWLRSIGVIVREGGKDER